MTVPTLTVERLTATVTESEDPRAHARLDRALRDLADGGLARALGGLSLPGGEWCLDRLDVRVPDPATGPAAGEDPSGRALAEGIAGAVAGELLAAVTRGRALPGWVHYRAPGDALADLVLSVVRRNTQRTWAWRQVGLLVAGDPEPDRAPAATLVAVLSRHPTAVAGLLSRAAADAGGAALHRALGDAAWEQLASVAAAAVGAAVPDPGQVCPPAAGADLDDGGRRDLVIRAEVAADASHLVSALRAAGIRPTPGTARSWAVLALADVDAPALRGALADATVHALARRLEGQRVPSGLGATCARSAAAGPSAGAPAGPSAGPSAGQAARDPGPGIDTPASSWGPDHVPDVPAQRPPGHRHRPALGVAAPDGPSGGRAATRRRAASSRHDLSDQPADLPTGGSSPTFAGHLGERAGAPVVEGDEGVATSWGGLLFLLSTAEAAGVGEELFAEPALRARPARWTMHHLGLLLVPAAPDDAAVAALTGAPPGEPVPPGAPGPVEADVLARWAHRWAAVTAGALTVAGHRPHADVADPAQVVRRVAARDGRVVGEPGWLELHLSLAEVDLAVRRAGLDLDPGWVPWLGTVVRFVYE